MFYLTTTQVVWVRAASAPINSLTKLTLHFGLEMVYMIYMWYVWYIFRPKLM